MTMENFIAALTKIGNALTTINGYVWEVIGAMKAEVAKKMPVMIRTK